MNSHKKISETNLPINMGFLSGFSKDAVITLDEDELPMPDKDGFRS